MEKSKEFFTGEKGMIVDQIVGKIREYGKNLSMAQINEILESTKDALQNIPIQFFDPADSGSKTKIIKQDGVIKRVPREN